MKRLGFDAWADNVFVNALEDYVFPFGKAGTGSISIEKKDYNMSMEWSPESVTCTIRAYTPDGWQNYQKEIKRYAV